MDKQNQGREGHNGSSASAKWIGTAILVVIVGIGGFIGGVAYQKGHQKTTSLASSSGFRGQAGATPGGPGGGQMGGFGTVTAISSSSISVKNSRTGSTTTYAISSSTTISDNGSTATTSDIQTGDTVIVQPASSGSTTASQIIVNPSMPSGGFGGGSTGSSTTAN